MLVAVLSKLFPPRPIVSTKRLFTRYPFSATLGAKAVMLSFVFGSVGCVQRLAEPGVAAPQQEGEQAEDLLIIDCLLPGQVRQLGASRSYLSARRPIKTTAADCEIRGGEYVAYDRANYASALKVWLPMAQAGDAEAQNYVGEIFEKGLAASADYATAERWYRKAADQGLARAQINLGSLYERGLGVQRDPQLALQWYRRAAGMNGAGEQLYYASTLQAAKVSQETLGQLQMELAAKTQEAAQARADLAQIEQRIQVERQRLQTAKQQHQAQINLLASQSQAVNEGRKQQIEQLKNQLIESKSIIDEQTAILAKLEKQAVSYETSLAAASQAERQLQAQQGPSIDIIDPAMTLTRGMPSVLLRSQTQDQEIIGKVSAPAGLKSFTVNGQAEQLDDYQLFWARIPINRATTQVAIEVVDQLNQTINYDFSIQATFLSTNKEAPPLPTPLGQGEQLKLGDYYALIIGNNEYQHLNRLNTAVNDAQAVARLLKDRYGFKTQLLLNASRYDILSTFNQLRTQLTEQDNLLIYYAGHGELDRINDRGYWLPVDAEPDNSANWISNVAVSDILNVMPAKHILVVADSCYSGTLSNASVTRVANEIEAPLKEEWIRLMATTRTRTVLTAGGIKPVLDGGGGNHSIFANAFLNVLEGNQRILEGHGLYRQVLREVRDKAAQLKQEQIPEYAPIKYAGHEAGEFFLQPL